MIEKDYEELLRRITKNDCEGLRRIIVRSYEE